MRLAVTMIVAGLMAVPASALAQDSSSSFSQLTGANGCVSQEPPLPGDDEAPEGAPAPAACSTRSRRGQP